MAPAASAEPIGQSVVPRRYRLAKRSCRITHTRHSFPGRIVHTFVHCVTTLRIVSADTMFSNESVQHACARGAELQAVRAPRLDL